MYRFGFHDKDGEGNLCWQAAFEQEIASLAVGIRSFPKEGLNAEKYLRDAYITQLTRLGGQVRVLSSSYMMKSETLLSSRNRLRPSVGVDVQCCGPRSRAWIR